MQRVGNPVPLFLDATGRLMDGGKIYVGVANGDPQVTPINVFFDSALTIPAAQPIRTIGGFVVNGTTPATLFVAETDYAMRVRDALDNLVEYSPSVFVAGSSFQPLDADLTAIALLATAAYGRSLLTATGADPFVTEAGNETLTNKTLTTPAINGGSLNAASVVTDSGTIATNSVGFRGTPDSAQAPGSAITLAAADNGKCIPNSTGGWAIPANGTLALPVGFSCLLYNNSGSTQTVSITTDTLRLAGTTSTGTRTVAVRGFCTLRKVLATEWVASGNVT